MVTLLYTKLHNCSKKVFASHKLHQVIVSPFPLPPFRGQTGLPPVSSLISVCFLRDHTLQHSHSSGHPTDSTGQQRGCWKFLLHQSRRKHASKSCLRRKLLVGIHFYSTDSTNPALDLFVLGHTFS